ncbi:hypothetical protein [Kiloniella litopenaei]|uniref:hypothetical protein n=1 Tax=Kiloniella litopenaei TaxID=1549748 RepID=UPI0012FEA3C9|nr:hypothetical protein [Kiloniella litopenaei]
MESIFSTLFMIAMVAFWNVISRVFVGIFYEIVVLSLWKICKWWGQLWIKAIRFVFPQSLRTGTYYSKTTAVVGSLLAIAINPVSISMVVYHWHETGLLLT